MPIDRTYTYEGLFLFPQSAVAELQATVDHLKEILHRANAEIIALKKWDERRLAYEIRGNKRGLYFLTYFKAPASKMAGLERDCNLSERMLRALVIRADHIPMEEMQAADAQAQLADEIKLRASNPAPAMAMAAVGAAETETVEVVDDVDDAGK